MAYKEEDSPHSLWHAGEDERPERTSRISSPRADGPPEPPGVPAWETPSNQAIARQINPQFRYQQARLGFGGTACSCDDVRSPPPTVQWYALNNLPQHLRDAYPLLTVGMRKESILCMGQCTRTRAVYIQGSQPRVIYSMPGEAPANSDTDLLPPRNGEKLQTELEYEVLAPKTDTTGQETTQKPLRWDEEPAEMKEVRRNRARSVVPEDAIARLCLEEQSPNISVEHEPEQPKKKRSFDWFKRRVSEADQKIIDKCAAESRF